MRVFGLANLTRLRPSLPTARYIMAKTLLGALALTALPAALAFGNTSPFFLASTADLHLPTGHDALADAATVTETLLAALEDCPTRSYLLFEQHGVSSDDFTDARSAPQLSRLMNGAHAHIKTASVTPDVLGHLDGAAIKAHLHKHCGPRHAHGNANAWLHSHVSRELAAPLDQAHRKKQLMHDDAFLGDYVSETAKEHDFTVIYITSPQTMAQAKAPLEHYDYESAFTDSVQMELKRDLSAHAKQSNATEGGLFERYQYFTPGLFMGFAAILPLFLILLVGIRALTSLEVSYFAFSKDMGPNAQKRQ